MSVLPGGMHKWSDSAQQQPMACDPWLNIAWPARQGHNKANERIARAHEKVQFAMN
jgi:hypothetical protein